MVLSSCAATVVDPRACPVEKQYTKQEQIAIADQLKTSGPAVRSAFVDYGKLRDKVRACRGIKKP